MIKVHVLTVAEFLELGYGREGGGSRLPGGGGGGGALGQQLPGGLGAGELLVEGGLEWGEAAAHYLLHLHWEVLGQDGGCATDDASACVCVTVFVCCVRMCV